MSTLYEVKNLTQRFGDREVLNIKILSLRSGIIYGLLGPNGAGKTTLMRILSFMDQPSSGEIFFKGDKVRREDAAGLRSKVVWVPQNPVMLTGSLLYNVEFPLALKKVKKLERRTRAMELLKLVRLESLARSPAPNLSGGEAQRGSIARALAAGAEVILFDEPTASVDFRSRGEIIELIQMLNQEHALSVIVTSHDADLASRLCHRHISLFDGKLVSEVSQADGFGAKKLSLTVPASLKKFENKIIFSIESSLLQDKQNKAKVTGLLKTQAGIEISLEGPQSALSVVVEAQNDMELAKSLNLGTEVEIAPSLSS